MPTARALLAVALRGVYASRSNRISSARAVELRAEVGCLGRALKTGDVVAQVVHLRGELGC